MQAFSRDRDQVIWNKLKQKLELVIQKVTNHLVFRPVIKNNQQSKFSVFFVRNMAYYDQNKYRGLALVIGNEKFDTKGDNIDRIGCVEDLKKMKQMFETLDFFVMCFKDLTAAQMKKKIELASKDARNEKCECFVLVLSTHGSETFDAKKNVWEHEAMGTDRINVRIEDILEMFDKRNAPGLAGKPKLFFIQACRSKDRKYSPEEIKQDKKFKDSTDPGIMAKIPVSNKSAYAEKSLPSEFSDDNSYSKCEDIYKGWQKDPECWPRAQDKYPGTQESSGDASGDGGGGADSGEMPLEPVDILRIKCPEDCLLYYPVVSGKWAFRNMSKGSYMMVYLWEQFPKLLRGLSIHEYLTYVNRAMADHEVIYDGTWKMTASVVHRMTKHLVFEPKSENSPMAKAKEIIERNDSKKTGLLGNLKCSVG